MFNKTIRRNRLRKNHNLLKEKMIKTNIYIQTSIYKSRSYIFLDLSEINGYEHFLLQWENSFHALQVVT